MRICVLLMAALAWPVFGQKLHVSVDLSGDWTRTEPGRTPRPYRLPLQTLQSDGPFRLEREIQLPSEGLAGLALLITPLGGPFTVLVNGQNIGGVAPEHLFGFVEAAPPVRSVVLPLPDGLLHAGVNRITIEVGGVQTLPSGNLPLGSPLLGAVDELKAIARGYERGYFLRNIYLPFNTAAQLLFVFILIGLSRGSPYRKGLLWLAAFFAIVALGWDLNLTLAVFASITRTVFDLARPFLFMLITGALTEASLAFLGVSLPWGLRLTVYVLAGMDPVARVCVQLLMNALLLVWALRTRNRMATIFQCLMTGYGVVNVLAAPPFGWFGLFLFGPFGFHVIPGYRILIGVGLIVWALWQSARDRNERERLAGELSAARTIQQLLVTGNWPEAEAAFLPAREVGGDLYQLAGRDGGATRLVVVGDVSGKGLQAAMLASVAVGAFRSTASNSPKEILSVMNRALAGQGHGGFVTCVCARIEAGHVTVSSAGHPAPYLDGVEIDTLPGLPLGIDSGAEYLESRHAFSTQATFVSDGVIEAANAQGELFGFDRTRALSTQSAQAIAEAAQQWGQNDDITVVTVRRNTAA